MKFFEDVRKNKTLLLMTLPVVAFFLTFSYLPMFGMIIAFKDFNYRQGIFGSSWAGLKNFEFLFRSGDAFSITRNTLLYNFTFIIGGTVLAVILAILFDALGKSRLNKINQTIVIMPNFISMVVVVYFVNAFLNADKGVMNKLLGFLGRKPVDWYSEKAYWPMILVFVHFWKSVGYSSIIYYASIRGFDVEYYEAARIDGASWLQQTWHITIPLLKAIVIVMAIMAIGRIFNSDFGLFYLVPKNSGVLYPVTGTVDTYVYNSMMQQGGNFGMSSAASFLQSVIGFATVLSANWLIRKVSREDAMF